MEIVDNIVGNEVPSIPVLVKVKADATCASVAAASVLAKEKRDALMREIASEFPMYGWESNVGYGSAGHMEAIVTHGPCKFHRRSWNLPGQQQA